VSLFLLAFVFGILNVMMSRPGETWRQISTPDLYSLVSSSTDSTKDGFSLLWGSSNIIVDDVAPASFLRNRQMYSKDDVDGMRFLLPRIDTSAIKLIRIHGNPSECTDVIYTGDSRIPLLPALGPEETFVYANWEALSHIVQLSPILNQTCLAFFQISQPFVDRQSHRELHPVWGRVPATVKMMQHFSQAKYFLYLDSDASLALPSFTPTTMYLTLAYDGYGENATNLQTHPGLIVNKPMTGWLCSECEKYGLGHGCFNSGALLWRKSQEASLVLQAWWDSRNDNSTQNFFYRNQDENQDEEHFHGWSRPDGADVLDKMGEQNRLMYIYSTNHAVRDVIWPVPRQVSEDLQSPSCPNAMDERHTPCLQNDYLREAKWNSTMQPSCFINHYADNKADLLDVLELVLLSFKQVMVNDKEDLGQFSKLKYRPSCDADDNNDFNCWSFNQRMEVFQKSAPMYWDARNEFSLFFKELEDELDVADGDTAVEIWKNERRDLVLTERMCTAARDFRLAGSRKEHVAIMHMNENWGAFSGRVPNRTVQWATMEETFGNCASYEEVTSYLDHPHTLAIVTAQFQDIDHPKAHSIPLGLSGMLRDTPNLDQYTNRTQLLMINMNESLERKRIIDTVVGNFKGTVHNSYSEENSAEDYVAELLRSKFVLSPSGLGWDCYRHWEALIYGAIPVIEHFNRTDGWYRVFDGLPVAWVSMFDEVTPEFLENEYKRLSGIRNYSFEKLTSNYWIKYVHSLRPKRELSPSSEDSGDLRELEDDMLSRLLSLRILSDTSSASIDD
jgi:galactosyl transferase GMA12/MNN10 family